MNGNTNTENQETEGRANIFDVAHHAGVSVVTVSRVFNNHPNVSPKMRERVTHSARVVAYKPKTVCRPRVIGLLVGDPLRYAQATDMNHICCRISLAAEERGFLTRIVPFAQREQLTRHAMDGVIEVELGESSLYGHSELLEIPMVHTQHRTLHPAWSSVTVDYKHEGRLALDSLCNLGHRRIAFLVDSFQSWTNQHRIRGIRQRRNSLGLPEDATPVLDFSATPLRELEGILRQDRVTALVNFSADRVSSLLDYLFNESSFRIPSELSLLTLDNSVYSAHYHPRVCSIRQNLDKIADKALEELISRLGGKGKNRNFEVQSHVVHRQTCQELR